METETVISLDELREVGRLAEEGLVSADELREAYKIALAVENYPATHPIECYRPLEKTASGGPHQLSFHQSGARGRAIFGGNQSGKTIAGAMEVAMHSTGTYPAWYPAAFRFDTPNSGRIVVKDFTKGVGEVIEPALMSAIPARMISSVKRNSQGYLTKLVSRTGSRFDIVTHDMDTQALEGWQGDWLWMDEPPPRDKYVASLRGLIRKSGRWWMTCTPLTEPWLYDEIYTNSEHFSATIDIRDNPYLKEDDIARFERSLTEDEKEARLHGRFMHLSGLTYKEFQPETHVKPRSTPIPSDWPRWMICDPHDRKPFAMIWFAVDPMGRLWFYDEWPKGWFHEMRSSDRSLKDYVHIMTEMEMGTRIYRRIMDGRAGKAPLLVGTESGEHQDSLFDAFDDLGLLPPFEPSYITTTLGITDPGHLRVKEYLRISSATDQPSLFVLESCPNLIYSFQHNVWEDFRSERLGVKEKQAQFAKDFLDLVRYGLMDDPHWVEPGDRETSSRPPSRPAWADRNLVESGRTAGYGYGTRTDW